MTDYISREAAIAVIYGQHVGGKEACENARPNTYGEDLREIVADIEDIPAADVRPARTARWTSAIVAAHNLYDHLGMMANMHGYVCGCCQDFSVARYNFCPNCGADMRPEPPKEET